MNRQTRIVTLKSITDMLGAITEELAAEVPHGDYPEVRNMTVAEAHALFMLLGNDNVGMSLTPGVMHDIKAMRMRWSMGLKEAKEQVELLYAMFGQQYDHARRTKIFERHFGGHNAR